MAYQEHDEQREENDLSQAEVERFVADIQTDEGLRNELAGHASGIGSVVSFANDKGYDVTAEEVRAYVSTLAGRDLSDDELDAVAGGQGSKAATIATVTNSSDIAAAVVASVDLVAVNGPSAILIQAVVVVS